ncbi:MAG: hypothetical protein AB7T06_25335 [Kofleriaceae bacterium]
MFDVPGLDMISPFLAGPLAAGGAGMDAGGAIADAASSAWDFGSGALSNLGAAFDPSMIVNGGPAAPAPEIALGLMDAPSMNDATADFQQDWIY